ncbi:MAG: type VI secretion system baseplate subunit TssG [Pseudomonadota bacterium]
MTDRKTHSEGLADDPEGHHIFHALRVLEAHFADAPRLGASRRPRDDKIRLGQEAELAFPTSSVAAFSAEKGGRPAKLVNRFFGLFGAQGPMPLHITEYARDRLRNHRDPTMVAFADLLTHRLMSLFYRAWVSGQPAPNFDRDDDDRLRRLISALNGYFHDALQERDAMPDLARNHYTGHLGLGTKHPEGLAAILRSFFAVPVHLEEFIGCWLELEPDDQWEMGQPAALGRQTSIGSRVWSRNSKFRIIMGPLTLDDYERLLPGTPSMDRLRAIVRNYVGDALDWEVRLILKGEEVPRAVMGGTTRLGQTGWLDVEDPDTRPDAGDLLIQSTSLGAYA